jgi:hypothetical protein
LVLKNKVFNEYISVEKFVPSPLQETLLEKPQPIRIVEHDDALSRGSLAPEPVDITAPEPMRAQHAVYRSHIDLAASYNQIE